MNKYEIIWEVSKRAVVEAKSEQDAMKKFWQDENLETEELEITNQPSATKL